MRIGPAPDRDSDICPWCSLEFHVSEKIKAIHQALHRRYTEVSEEERYVIKENLHENAETLSKMLFIPQNVIRRIQREMKKPFFRGGMYSPEEIQFIKDNIVELTAEEIASELTQRFGTKRTRSAISTKAWHMGLSVRKCVCQDDKEYIYRHYHKKTKKEIGSYLGIAIGTVQKYGRMVGLTNPIRYYTSEEDNFIIDTHFEHGMEPEEVAAWLNRSVVSIKRRIRIIGPQRSPKG